MSSLFIFGNGFDIAHGLSTKYLDFRKYIIEKYNINYNYNLQISFDDLFEKDLDELSVELLLSAMDDATDENWSDFEDALGYFNFQRKFPKRENTEDEYGNHNDDNIVEYLQMMDIMGNVFIYCSKNWQVLFSQWIKSIQTFIDNNQIKSKPALIELFNNPTNKYLTFNYTKTLQTVYGIKKVIHIHNRKGQKLVFGHGVENPRYEESFEIGNGLGSSFLDDMLLNLKKDTDTQMKKYKEFFKYLSEDIDKVYSYGFSYCKVDSVYIKEIISKIADDATWYFTDFEAQDKEGLRIKKIRLRNYGFKGKFDTYKT